MGPKVSVSVRVEGDILTSFDGVAVFLSQMVALATANAHWRPWKIA